MSVQQWILLQQELFGAWGWLIRWWLILFAAAGTLTSIVVAVLVTTRSMIDDS